VALRTSERWPIRGKLGGSRGRLEGVLQIEEVVLILGGGEMASATAHRLCRCGFRVCITEIPQPLAVRRGVSFCTAVYTGHIEIEGVRGQLVSDVREVPSLWARGEIPVFVDSRGEIRKTLKPRMAKRNLGTQVSDAPLVVGLGPGLRPGVDVHCVVETNRGHNLGRIWTDREAEPDTGIPGVIGGYGIERVLKAPAAGIYVAEREIGETIQKGDRVARVADQEIRAAVGGVLRGLLCSGLKVTKGLKVGDIDPRGEPAFCYTISDKARTISGGVLEAILHGLRGTNRP